jgi:uncharacterized coiled-coil protein SlyX
MEQRIDRLEKRSDALETMCHELLENQKELLKLAKLTRFDTQETKAIAGRIEVEEGTIRERIDHVEQTQSEQKKQLDHIEKTQTAHTEVLDQIMKHLQEKLP